MFIGGKLLLCFLLLHSLQSTVVGQGDSECVCPNPHPQDKYCRNENVVLGKVRATMPNNIYTVQIKRMFKGSTEGINLTIDRIKVVADFDSDCNANINDTNKYLFYANNTRNGMMVLEKCSTYRWGPTKRHIRHGLDHSLFGAGCDCWTDRTEVYNECRWKNAYLKKNGSTCYWESYIIAHTCS